MIPDEQNHPAQHHTDQHDPRRPDQGTAGQLDREDHPQHQGREDPPYAVTEDDSARRQPASLRHEKRPHKHPYDETEKAQQHDEGDAFLMANGEL
ncbi:MAG: hypothetical protein IH820_17370 [Bacteroidetes bacterium]|nr:hypothetical protein [Bacteroidota bacterium]